MPDTTSIDATGYDNIIIDRGNISVGRKIVEGMQLVLQNYNYSYGNYLQKLADDDGYKPVFALLGYAALAAHIAFDASGKERIAEDGILEKMTPLTSSCDILASLNAEGHARRVVDTLMGAIRV